MEKAKLKFAIFGNIYQSEKSDSIKTLLNILHKEAYRIAIDAQFYAYIHNDLNIDFEPDEIITDDNFEANFAVSIGGDGTFLNTAARVSEKEIPMIGINTGHLGFLADISTDAIAEAITCLQNGSYCIERRSMLRLISEQETGIPCPLALNEVAIMKHDNSSMISIETYIDNHYLATYKSDGLIVSTPTGSTGYSLSVGGPIICPSSNSIVLTPIAAHSLNVRPIVLDDQITVRLSVRSRNHSFLVSLDGRSQSCNESVQLKIRKAPQSIFVVKRNGNTFFDTLRNKLMWGADQRI